MSKSTTHSKFRLVVPSPAHVYTDPSDDVTLPCHLSPKTSAVTTEIRWFRKTHCICLCKNGQVTEGRGYEDRLSMSTEELQRGNVSLVLRNFRYSDRGEYRCQVIHGQHKMEDSLRLHAKAGKGHKLPLRRKCSNKLPPNFSELRLVLLGLSETVKWAAGNTILGREEFGIQAATSTETQHSESRQGEVAGRQLVVVDTPDWLSPGLSQEEMRKDVGLCVRLSAPGPHTFLLVCPLEPSEGEESELLEDMEDIFGESLWRHTVIFFICAEEIKGKNMDELVQNRRQDLQQLIEKCGNRCHLLTVKDRTDVTEVPELLEKIEEMVSKYREEFYSSEMYEEDHRKAVRRSSQTERKRNRGGG